MTEEGHSLGAVSFRSTSSMSLSGSAYGAHPMLDAEGIAVINGQSTSYTLVKAPRGPHKASVFDDDAPDMVPIGDAVWPLLLMVWAYLLIRARRKVKA